MLQIAFSRQFEAQLSGVLRTFVSDPAMAGATCDTGYLSWSLMCCHVSCQHIGNYVILADHICTKRSPRVTSVFNTFFVGTIDQKNPYQLESGVAVVKVVIVEIECLSCINFVQMISISWCLVVVRSHQPPPPVSPPPEPWHITCNPWPPVWF